MAAKAKPLQSTAIMEEAYSDFDTDTTVVG